MVSEAHADSPQEPIDTTTPSGRAGQLYLLLRGLGVATQLVTLDKVWTTAAQSHAIDPPDTADPQQAPPPTKDELLGSLNIIREAYEQTWLDFADVAEQLEPVFAEHADVIRQGQPALMEQTSESGRVKLRRALDTKDDLAAAAQTAAANMRTSANSEIALMRAEVAKITNGGTSEGDMSSFAEAGVAAVAGASTVVLGPGGPALIELAAHTDLGESIIDAIGDGLSAAWNWLTGS